MRRNACRYDYRKNSLKLSYIFRLAHIFVKLIHQLLWCLIRIQYLSKLLEFRFLECLYIACRCVKQILIKFILVSIQKLHCISIRYLTDSSYPFIKLLHLIALQVCLKRQKFHSIFHMLLIFHQVCKCLFSLL